MKNKIIILIAALFSFVSNDIKAQCTTNAGPDSIICGLSCMTYADYDSTILDGWWTGPYPSVFCNPNSPSTCLAVNAPGSYTFTWTVVDQYGDTCSDDVNITFMPNPPSDFIVTSPVCAGDPAMISLNFINNILYSYIWTTSPGGIPTTLSGPGPHSVYWNTPGIVTVSLTVTNTSTGCVSNVTTKQIQVLPAGTSNCCVTPIPFAGTDVYNNCGLSYTLNGSIPAPGNSAVWSLVSGVGVASFSDSSLFNSSVMVSDPGTYVFQWHETSGACDSSDNVVISFIPLPVAEISSDSIQICGNQIQLVSIQSVYGSAGMWSVVPPVSATFSPTNLSDTVTVTATSGYGTYYFVWTEATSMQCYSRDTISVYFAPVPTPDAGPDQRLCQPWVELSATTTPGSTGYWTGLVNMWFDASVWPNDTINCPSCYTNTNVVYRSPTEGYWDLIWTEFDGQCYGRDTVNILFGYLFPATTLVDPADTLACGTVFSGLDAQLSPDGIGYWYDTDTLTQFYPNNSTTNPDSVVIANNTFGMHHFYWVLDNGCIDTSDVVEVNFINNGWVYGNVSGIGALSNFTAAIFETGSPIAKGSCSIDMYSTYQINAPSGNYYLKVGVDYPTSTPGFAATYYGNTWKWEDALTVSIPACNNILADITMYTFPLATGGQCRAYGTVMYDNGGPVENANVYLLYKPVNTPAILELTDASGYYSLNNIPNGNYKIQVDIPGLPQVTTHHITVNSNDTLFPDVNFIVDTINISKEYGYGIYADSNFVYGIGEPLSAKHPVHIYPVPFSNELFMESYNDGNITIEWYSQDGRMISSSEANIIEGRNRLDIPYCIDNGIFYLKVVSGNTVYIKKIVKE